MNLFILNKFYKKKNILISYLLELFFKVVGFININSIENKIKNLNQLNDLEKKFDKLKKLKEKNASPYLTNQLGQFCNENFPQHSESIVRNLEVEYNEWAKKNKKKNIRYIPIETAIGSFGNYRPLYYYLLQEFNFKSYPDKPNLLIRKNEVLNNNYLFKSFKNFLNLEVSTINFFFKKKDINNLTLPLNYMIKLDNTYLPYYKGINQINKRIYNFKGEKKFEKLKLNDEDIKKGNNILKEINLNLDNKKNWFVLLHIRETTNDTSQFRNANPLTYLNAIKKIINHGGKVIRVGDKDWLGSKITKFPEIEGFIDYPFSKIKSKFMDIFLASECKFCIGTSSGYWTVPCFFNKPVLLTNYLPTIDYFTLRKQDIFLPKTLFYKDSSRKVELEKIFSLPTGWLGNDNQYKNFDIQDNSSEEITRSVEEMLKNLGIIKGSEGYSENKDQEQKFLDKLSLTHNNELSCFAKISGSFVEKYY